MSKKRKSQALVRELLKSLHDDDESTTVDYSPRPQDDSEGTIVQSSSLSCLSCKHFVRL